MTPSSRDRIAVDLHGLKAALFERAKALGVSPSGLVRSTLANALCQSVPLAIQRQIARGGTASGDRVRLSLRMTREQAATVNDAASRAVLNPGEYVAKLIAGVPALTNGARHSDHVAALIASSAEMSTLTRNINHLTSLLRQGEYHAAGEYRAVLETLVGDIRGHLMLASRVLADLRPRSQRTNAQTHSTN